MRDWRDYSELAVAAVAIALAIAMMFRILEVIG
jgi:hypothetical protein